MGRCAGSWSRPGAIATPMEIRCGCRASRRTSPPARRWKKRCVRAKSSSAPGQCIPQLCGMADPGGNFFWYNQRWYEYTGLTPSQTREWVGNRRSTPGPPARPSQAGGVRLRPERPSNRFLIRARRRRGSPLPGASHAGARSEGRIVRWFGTMTDISEQRKTEEALRKPIARSLPVPRSCRPSWTPCRLPCSSRAIPSAGI